jgi:hypothetical protein
MDNPCPAVNVAGGAQTNTRKFRVFLFFMIYNLTMKEGKDFLPKKEEEQIELPLNILGALTELMKKFPESERNIAVQDKWNELKKQKLSDGEIMEKLSNSHSEDWEKNPAYFYALVLEDLERNLPPN